MALICFESSEEAVASAVDDGDAGVAFEGNHKEHTLELDTFGLEGRRNVGWVESS